MDEVAGSSGAVSAGCNGSLNFFYNGKKVGREGYDRTGKVVGRTYRFGFASVEEDAKRNMDGCRRRS